MILELCCEQIQGNRRQDYLPAEQHFSSFNFQFHTDTQKRQLSQPSTPTLFYKFPGITVHPKIICL